MRPKSVEHLESQSAALAEPPEGPLPFYPYRFMGIDVGSNAIKYRVWEILADGSVTQITERRFPVRLGESVFTGGVMSEKVIAAAAEAFVTIRQDLESIVVNSLRAVATSAAREASNSLTLVAAVQRAAGIRLEILPAAEEARMVALGVLGTRKQLHDQYLLIDIGGGSTEIILTSGQDLAVALSLRLGAVRLRQMFVKHTPPRESELSLVHDFIDDVLTRKLTPPRLDPGMICLGSAGTITTLCTMVHGATGEEPITPQQIDAIIERIKPMTPAQIVEAYGLEPDRSEVILYGALVLQQVLRHLGVERIGRTRGGVSDGLLQSFMERIGLRGSELFDHDRAFMSQALALGERCRFNRPHAEQVARLALAIFDQTKALHGLGDWERGILRGAAILHEIGQFVSFSGHHKHTYYLVTNADLPGLSQREKLLIACIGRYHRRSHPKLRHEGYRELSPADREVVRKLAAIERLADALDREQQSLVRQVHVQIGEKKVAFHIQTHYEATIEVWNAREKAALFEEVFKRKAEFLVVHV